MKLTNKSLERALNRARKHLLSGPSVTTASSDAGIVVGLEKPRGQREGYQVFVKVCRFSEKLLKDYPMTGGLTEFNHLITDIWKVKSATKTKPSKK